MIESLTRILILWTVCSGAWAEPGVHTLRIRFPGPSSDKVVLPGPAKQSVAPYPAAGFKPEPAFELPQATYLPPTEPELSYGPPEEPELAYGPPAEVNETPAQPHLTYGPPSDTYEQPQQFYGPPDITYPAPEFNEFPSAAIVNAPLSLASQFTPPRPNKAANFRPLLHPKPIKPQKPVSHLTLPSTQRVIVFRPRYTQVLPQDLYPKTYLTLPRVERVVEFRPHRVPHQQQPQTHFFSRPLPTSIFGNSNKFQAGRQLPSKIFSK